jgi:hypothetical protein
LAKTGEQEGKTATGRNRSGCMKKRFSDAKELYHLRDYAILKAPDGTYEYVMWDVDKGDKTLQWLSGKAFILNDLLVLTRIVDEGTETFYKTIKDVRKALKKLPDWWKKTTYYCVVVDRFASPPCYCTSGKPIEENGEDYKRIQDALRRSRVELTPRNPSGKLKGIERAITGDTDPF